MNMLVCYARALTDESGCLFYLIGFCPENLTRPSRHFAKRINPRRALSEFLEPKQHRQHPLQLAVQMDLVATEALKFVGVEGFPKA